MIEAMGLAKKLGLEHEADRLQIRRDPIKAVFRSEFNF